MKDSISSEFIVKERTVEAVRKINKTALSVEQNKEERLNFSSNAKAKESQKEIDSESIIRNLEKFVKAFNTRLEFKVDPETGSRIQVRDKETGKLIRQIPREEMNDLRNKMDEITGMLFNRRI